MTTPGCVPGNDVAYIRTDSQLGQRNRYEALDFNPSRSQSRFGVGWDKFANEVWAV
jgi:hypothetical protein